MHHVRRALALAVGAPVCGAVLLDAASGPVREEMLPRVWDSETVASVWARRPVRVLARAGAVLGELAPLGGALALDAARGALGEAGAQASHARALRDSLVRLGPAFIKLGQALSSRPDVLPAAALKELESLVDACPSYPDEQARAIVLAELGCPFDELFDTAEFGSAPVAAASLGQVYRVRERATGDVLALKVQRPGMMRAISLDLQLLGLLATAADALGAAFTRQQPYHRELLRAFSAGAWSELDYEHEADNQAMFRTNFGCDGQPRADSARARTPWQRLVSRADAPAPRAVDGADGAHGGGARASRRTPPAVTADATPAVTRASARAVWSRRVYIPMVYRGLTSRRVLATEWVQGEYLARSPPDVIARLVPIGIACFLQQLLQDGLFHADAHPGNLIVTTDGRLALIDFGLCARVPAPDTRKIGAAILHALDGDVPRLLDDAIALGFLPADVDRVALTPLLRRVLATSTDAVLRDAARAGAGGGAEPPAGARRESYAAVMRRRRHFGTITDDLNNIFFRFPFRVPDYFALITRALVVLEGIALTADPSFDLLESAAPWVARHALRDALETRGDGAERADAATARRVAIATAASPQRAASRLAAKLAAGDVVAAASPSEQRARTSSF
ncbi:hypothetical protein KFE25_004323 [Diacronema lutheri]|uniref:ABC1 atypical kinase-like domain-containing protein n=2 Tax=Diacronema lutheri TaxID=2081491 RepID=A0A8J5X8J2_DIALT|nr:hypothetical protein KFE25_004323 [Diacronema lutheri]